MIGVILGVINGVTSVVTFGVIIGSVIGSVFIVILSQFIVMSIYCLYLTHVSVTQQKTELMERMNGTELLNK